MLLKLILFILFLGTSAQSFGLSDVQANRLSLLAKTWSAGKNFHSGACNISWDDELINAIPLVLESTSSIDFNQNINALLDKLGTNSISDASIPTTPKAISQTIDLSWTDDVELDQASQLRIKQLIQDFRPRANCFVSSGNVGNGGFGNDDLYFSELDPTKEQRVLGLVRFWNIINYYFPYKNLIDVPWDGVLDSYIEKIYESGSKERYTLLMREFTAKIQDSHAFFSSPSLPFSRSARFLPFRIKTIQGKVIVYKKIPSQTNINIGDEVLKIDGFGIDEFNKSREALSYGSNPITKQRNTDDYLNVGFGNDVEIELKKSSGEVYTIKVNYGGYNSSFYAIQYPKFGDMDQQNCSIGYINMGLLQTSDVPSVMDNFKNKDSIIFDLRHYPNQTLWTLVNYLFPQRINIAKFAKNNFNYPGSYSWDNEFIGSGTSSPYSGRIVILMNEETQSQAEYTVMGLEQHPNSVKIGSQTSAADGDFTLVKLPGEITAYFTGLGVYYPDETPTQRVGIIPDLFIVPTIEGIKQGRDEVLEKALDCNNLADLNWPNPITPKSGLYWDPKKSGRGIDIAKLSEKYTIVPYDYRDDGSPVWYLGVANSKDGKLVTENQSVNEFYYDLNSGLIESMQTNDSMKFDFKRGPLEIDCAVLDPTSKILPSRLTWSSEGYQENRCLQEFTFSNDSTATDFSGLWWGGAEESGWGLSFNTQGKKIVAVVYSYDTSGKSTWVIGSGTFNNEGSTTLDLLKMKGFCANCEEEGITSTLAGSLTVSLQKTSQEFEVGNWVSIKSNSILLNREKMPIKMFSVPK